jgi:C-terminal processing protease CtpA/Prc
MKSKKPLPTQTIIILVFTLASLNNSYATPSKFNNTSTGYKVKQINKDSLSKQQIKNLVILSKVWGFLKYYHPAVAGTKLNWDSVLVNMLPSYMQISDQQKRNAFLGNWIKNLGTVKECTSCNDSILTGAKIKPDLQWITNSNALGKELSALLTHIRANRHQGEQHYVKLEGEKPNEALSFINEEPYDTLIFPEYRYRLLSVFRFWNMVEYWFAYKHLIGEPWDNTLQEFIPRMMAASNEKEYVRTTREMIVRMRDSHAFIRMNRSSGGKYYYPPVKIMFVGNNAVVSHIVHPVLAQSSNLQLGDVVSSINGKPMNQVIKEGLPYSAGSNYPRQLRNLAVSLLGGTDSVVEVEILRKDKKITTKLLRFETDWFGWWRYDFPHQGDSTCFFPEKQIGYINIYGKFTDNTIDSFFKLLKDAKGIILDHRQYTRGNYPVMEILGRLLPNPVPVARMYGPTLDYPGAFLLEDPIVPPLEANPNFQKMKVVILVNEESISSSEYATMIMQTIPGAVVVGSQTAGANGWSARHTFPGGIFSILGYSGILYPDGREMQRTGIALDVVVKPTIKGIREGRDELMEKAIELIKNSGPSIPR